MTGSVARSMVVIPTLVVVTFVVLVDIVLIDRNASVAAAADAGADRRGVSAIAGHDTGPGLRNEDQIPLGIRRDRMRSRRLRDGFDQDAGPVDHAEHGRLLARRRARRALYGAIPGGGRGVAPG